MDCVHLHQHPRGLPCLTYNIWGIYRISCFYWAFEVNNSGFSEPSASDPLSRILKSSGILSNRALQGDERSQSQRSPSRAWRATSVWRRAPSATQTYSSGSLRVGFQNGAARCSRRAWCSERPLHHAASGGNTPRGQATGMERDTKLAKWQGCGFLLW